MNPQSFGKYQLIKKLATGGMAEVWLARQTGIEGFHKNVVVKRILPHLAEDHEFVEMFRNEALIAARFNHPNIAQVYEFGEANGTYFIAMEFIHGEDLGRVMRKAYNAGQWLSQPLTLRIVASACEGLYYAHTRTDERGQPLKVVHRDISPQNILISFDGSVKLVDFGIAKAADQASLTKSGAIKGKFAYMAPEQAAGKPLDQRADIFAIGLVLYELLTGQRPFKRESELGSLQAALACEIQPPSQFADVPPELEEVVMKALAKAADDRYENARQFQLALEEFLVTQRWVTGSVQISELMEMLFADRLEEERRNGGPVPVGEDSAVSGPPMPPEPPPAEPPPPPRGARSSTHTVASDMSWEAPPGEMSPQKARTTARPSLRGRSDSGTQTQAALSEDQEWEAPEATSAGPRRRTSSQEATTMERAVSRAEVLRSTGAELPSVRRTGNEVSPVRRPGTRNGPGAGAESEAPRPSRASAPAVNPRARRLEQEEDDERTVLPEPPRRRAGSRAEMPEAPPVPRRRTSLARMEREEEDEASVSVSAVKPVASVASERARPPVKKLVLAVVALALVGVGAVFHEPLWKTLNSSAIDGQRIVIDLVSNEPVEVFVEHGSHCGGEGLTPLGPSPLSRKEGAHVRDTLVLVNKQLGISKRLPIPVGAPNEPTRSFREEFRRGDIRLKLHPGRNLAGVEIFRGGQPLASYQPGLSLELVEGTHQLELRGAVFKEPVPVEVEVKARESKKDRVPEKVVDVSGYLQ